jgi:hypothetical protein
MARSLQVAEVQAIALGFASDPSYSPNLRKRLFCEPEVLKEKIKRAPYARLSPDEVVFIMLDTSDNKSVRGIVCTDKGIYFAYSLDDRVAVGRRAMFSDMVPWAEVKSIAPRAHDLMCNGKIAFVFQVSPPDMLEEEGRFALSAVTEIASACIEPPARDIPSHEDIPAAVPDLLESTIKSTTEPLLIYFYKHDEAHQRFMWFAEEIFRNYCFFRRCRIVTMEVSNHPSIVKKFAFTYLPACRGFVKGRMIGGRGVGDIYTATELLENTLGQLKEISGGTAGPPSTSIEYSDIEKASRMIAKAENQRKAAKAGKTAGDWMMVPMSGLSAGVVAAISFEKIPSAGWMLPAAIAWGVCILNRGFRFSVLQKAVATIIMLYITFEWRQLARLLMNN